LNPIVFTLLTFGAYLLGAVPFGLLIGKARGVDIRLHGSRNIGATNAGRVLGRPWGYLCLALDILKGFAPTFVASYLIADRRDPDAVTLVMWLAIALAAVLGHVFPVYLKFRGGKGVATTIGVALGIFPYLTAPMLATLLVYAAVRLPTGIVSLGSLAIAIGLPVSFFAYTRLLDLPMSDFWPLQAAAVLLGLLILIRHRENIGRLLKGTESRQPRRGNGAEGECGHKEGAAGPP
jgi:glycerol-3-phosphate acyltransferase PlsY